MTVGVERPKPQAVTGQHRVVRIHPDDNVAVAVDPLAAGDVFSIGRTIEARTEIPAGHKVALERIAQGDPVTKYGFPIGRATTDIEQGEWIHSHNLGTALSGTVEYRWDGPHSRKVEHVEIPAFEGYRRADGRVGTRNEIWVLNTVGCVNHAAERIAKLASDRFSEKVDGVHAFSHPYGCSQLGDDLRNTQRVLAGLMRHPNAGGVLLLGLGCENNQIESLLSVAGDVDRVTKDLRIEQLLVLGGEDFQTSGNTGTDCQLRVIHSNTHGFLKANPCVGAFDGRLIKRGILQFGEL